MAGMGAVAEAIGVSLPVLQFLICFFLTIPCSFLRRFIKGATNRHAYSALTGAVLSYYSFGSTSNLLFVLPIVGSYASMLLYRTKSGFITAFIAFTYLISCFPLIREGAALALSSGLNTACYAFLSFSQLLYTLYYTPPVESVPLYSTPSDALAK